MREWLNQRFNNNFSEEDLSSIKDFSLIWNVFERVVCQTNFSTPKVKQGIVDYAMNAVDFSTHLIYFQQRYVTNDVLNQRFPHLNFRIANQQELVENVLVGRNTDNDDVILALILIVYRYRNNLFHGIKDMKEIDQQKDNFDNANKVLQLYLNHF